MYLSILTVILDKLSGEQLKEAVGLMSEHSHIILAFFFCAVYSHKCLKSDLPNAIN